VNLRRGRSLGVYLGLILINSAFILDIDHHKKLVVEFVSTAGS
jgi:hypothetical protein